MDIGYKIPGSMAGRTGTACKWTRPPFRSCSTTCCGVVGFSAPRKHCASAPQSRRRPVSSFVTDTTQQDRAGRSRRLHTPFTLAVEIAALLVAADAMDEIGKIPIANIYVKSPMAGTSRLITGLTPSIPSLTQTRHRGLLHPDWIIRQQRGFQFTWLHCDRQSHRRRPQPRSRSTAEP